VDFAAPNAGTDSSSGTFPWSINSGGTIIGDFADALHVYHGFIRAPSGDISAFDCPGASGQAGSGTFPVSINSAGVIVGTYNGSDLLTHGFIRELNGNIVDLDVADGTRGTSALSINSAGVVTGSYDDVNENSHGFVRSVGELSPSSTSRMVPTALIRPASTIAARSRGPRAIQTRS
jgi:uncharacterized membrane protein